MSSTPPPFKIHDGTLEALKWLALVLMTGDHINTYLLGGKMPMLYAAGRMAFPLFAFVLAYNLARPGARAAYRRTAVRLTALGAIAMVVFVAPVFLGADWRPLNIMFTFLAALAIIALLDAGGWAKRLAALAVFLASGAFVDYFWPGLILLLSMYWFLRTGQAWALLVWMIALVLALPLQSLLLYHAPLRYAGWTIGTLPLLALASRIAIRVPRTRWLFYVYYPVHLLAIWALGAMS